MSNLKLSQNAMCLGNPRFYIYRNICQEFLYRMVKSVTLLFSKFSNDNIQSSFGLWNRLTAAVWWPNVKFSEWKALNSLFWVSVMTCEHSENKTDLERAFLKLPVLTHWGRVTHICMSNLTIIGSNNGLLPGRRQAIIWTNAEILLIGPLGTNFSEILIKIHTFSFKKMHLKMVSGKCRPFCLSLSVLISPWWTLQRLQSHCWVHWINFIYHRCHCR